MRLLTVLGTQKNRLASSHYFGYTAIIAAAALTGLLHVVSKPLLDSAGINGNTINPLTLAAIIYLINGLFFTPLKKDTTASKFDKKSVFFLIIISVAEVSSIITYFYGLKESTAVNASILTNSEILFSILVAITVLRERIKKKEIPAFSMIAVGVILLPIGYDLYINEMVFTELVFGNLLLLLSGVLVALDVNLCRYVSGKFGPKKITQIVSYVGAGFAFALILIFQIPFDVNPEHLPSIAIIGLFGTGMATYFFLVAIKLIGTVRTVLLYSTSSVFGVIFASLLLHEGVTLPNVFSIILVTVGLYILRDRLGRPETSYKPVNSKLDVSSFDKLCKECTHHGCCTGFANPVVFSHDLANLKSIGKSGDNFLQEVKIDGKNVKVIRKKSNSNVCTFYDEDKRICSIYQNRPFDCRAYPFDICLVDNKYHWIVYSCNPDADWTWSEKYLQMLENDVQFNEVMEKIDVFATTALAALRKSHVPFTVLREVRSKKIQIL